jgi:hypothetical protein
MVMIAPDDPQRWCVDAGDGQWGYPIPADKRFALKPGSHEPLRRMDVVAMVLSQKETLKDHLAPATFYCWSRELRDVTIAKQIQRLRAAAKQQTGRK